MTDEFLRQAKMVSEKGGEGGTPAHLLDSSLPISAEQSVVQETLDACTQENVEQMQHALDVIYRQHSRGYQHDYQARFQLLDVDMSGLPCGRHPRLLPGIGYFAGQYHRRGRQVGRVLATLYEEVVVDRLFAGNVQLMKALQPLVEAAETTLELDVTLWHLADGA